MNSKWPLILHVDWSARGIGAMLTQYNVGDQEYLAATISRSMNIHAALFSPYNGEMLGIVWSVMTFRVGCTAPSSPTTFPSSD